MLGKVVLTALIVVLAMAEVKHGWLLARVGLTGSCSVYSVSSSGARWEMCKPGALGGRPSLSSKGCTTESSRAALEYWYCPVPLDSAPSGF